jgi:hypothetical protein
VLRSRLDQADRAPITDRNGRRCAGAAGRGRRRAPDRASDGDVQRVAELTDVDGRRPGEAGTGGQARRVRRGDHAAAGGLRRAARGPAAHPGVVFREEVRQLAPTTAFARALLGSVGPATAEVVEASKGRVRADQVVGLSGLQKRYDEQLGGTPGIVVESVDAAGELVKVLLDQPGEQGEPLQLTLDAGGAAGRRRGAREGPERQAGRAGGAAAQHRRRPRGGQRRSGRPRRRPCPHRPLSAGVDLQDRVDAGALREGLTPEESVACPATVSVQGKSFKNAEGEVLGNPPFRKDFALSCNTAFVGSADRVTSEQLQQAAKDLGYAPVELGVDAFGGDVPVTDDRCSTRRR